MTETATFKKWLDAKLRELDTDESVFGAYIIGILEVDETQEEKREALNDILAEIITDNLKQLIDLMLDKWQECHPHEQALPSVSTIDVNEQLAKLLEAQKLHTVKEREYTEEERRIKEQILAQYSQTEISDDDAEDADYEDDEIQLTNAMGGIERNTNAQDVMQLQKDRREQARMDSAAKKQKDKEDREKQKREREEKKEKRKTVKGERRR